ncbi:MAG TPA: serine protease [Clostridiaceae bacterium]|jgi:ATP-dependent protease ClpP protease subunit|nr:MAG: Serine dehydrogenase proteinase [Bacteroidetes bacterium ADurb.Bin041]HHT24361.1 serine protease [Clostridiaceae bacterium]
MPSRHEITNEIVGNRQDAVRRKYLKEYYEHTGRNLILFATAYGSKKLAIQQIPDFLISITQEDIQGFMSAVHELKGDKLDIIIHNPGGSAEATEQIVLYLRQKFSHIRAIIPQNAMSAATMLSCACDELIMAKHSAIGPIDPQMGVIANNGSRYMIPAQSILDEFEQAKQEIIKNPELATLWVNRINSYPHGFFKKCEDTIDLSIRLVGNWLNTYMFANSDEKKGETIAEWLCNSGEHKTHGRPISIDKAVEKGLKVIPLESDQKLQDIVLSIFHSTMVTFDVTQCVKIIENQEGKGWFSIVNVEKK